MSPLNINRLPDLPEVWSHPTSGSVPVRLGGLVMVIEPQQQAVVALDAQTGAPRWRVAAPKGMLFSSLLGREPDGLWVTGYSDTNKFAVARITFTGISGKLNWSLLSEDLGDPRLADVGIELGLMSRARCQLRIVDGTVGRLLPQSLFGHHIEEFPHDGPPHSMCQVTTSLHLVYAPRKYVVTSDYQGRGGLSALDDKGQTAWRLSGRYFRLLHADSESAVFFSYLASGHSRLFRVRLETGQLLWQSELQSSCESDGNSRHAQLIRPPGAAALALIQNCSQARTEGLARFSRGVVGNKGT